MESTVAVLFFIIVPWIKRFNGSHQLLKVGVIVARCVQTIGLDDPESVVRSTNVDHVGVGIAGISIDHPPCENQCIFVDLLAYHHLSGHLL